MASRPTACLLDVYDTVLHVDARRHLAALADRAGIDPSEFAAAVQPWGEAINIGRATIGSVIAEVLPRWGRDPDESAALAAADLELLAATALVPADAVPFLEGLRAAGVRTAFVSNCADNTRPMLQRLGLADLVDEMVLSCEVGAAKPDPGIFTTALERLGVRAKDTLFVDDQQDFCDVAIALGIASVRIDRRGGSGDVATLDELSGRF